MERVFIGMSGGVDSSVAAALLKERGYDTVGVTLRLKPGDGADGDIEDAKNVAKALKIEHCVLDLRGEFKEKVMDYFAAEYLRGATPNPCVVCNREIKFGAMLKFALENGGDYVATGHYASLDKSGEHTKLLRSDSAKDQSYFLCMLSEFQLAHAMFPIDGMEKSAIRALAEKFSLPVAQKKDSQEVCFIPDNDYSSFIRSHGFKDMGEGDFLDTQGNVIGRHKYNELHRRSAQGARRVRPPDVRHAHRAGAKRGYPRRERRAVCKGIYGRGHKRDKRANERQLRLRCQDKIQSPRGARAC